MAMRQLKQVFLTAIVAGVLSTPSYSQDINLQGKVVDQYGVPVTQARLTLKKLLYSCITDNNGLFRLDKSSSGVIQDNLNAAIGTIGITPKFLELGNYYDAAITVFSIRGAAIGRMTVTNQNRVALDKLIPSTVTSQAVVISIGVNDRIINLKSIKCGTAWFCNDHPVIEKSQSAIRKEAAAAIIDTLLVEKDNLQTVAQPVSALIATLPDIILKYAVDPVDTSSDNENATILGDVAFSEPSKTFKTSLSVTLTTQIAGAEIRYTTDSLLPTASSTLYSTAIAISKTMQLRTAAFVAGVQSGKPSTAIYVARDFDYTSDIPIIIMEGYGGGKPKDKYNFIDLGFLSFEPVNGVASIDNTPTIATRAGYHIRGQSSCGFKQSPYRVELWDNDNNEVKYPLCGMPRGSDWAFISPYTDFSLIRNVFAFDIGKAIGLAAIQYRFAEVFINQDGGVLQKSDYQGIYQIIQPIKNRKNTLDLKKLDSTDTGPEKISGGYILKFDQSVMDTNFFEINCTGAEVISGIGMGSTIKDTAATCFGSFELVDPGKPNRHQVDWITAYVQEFHDALHAKPMDGWKKYVDINSFVNIHILNEFTCNVDAWIRSHFMYKERNKPITAGPVWDYNFALGNYTTDHHRWHVDTNRIGSNDWHLRMWKQPEFKTAFKNRYTELRKTVLSDASVTQCIDDVKKPINNAAERNFTTWPMKNQTIDMAGMMACMGGGLGGGGRGGLGKEMFMRTPKVTDTTWTGQIDSLKVWTKGRLKTLDSLVETLP